MRLIIIIASSLTILSITLVITINNAQNKHPNFQNPSRPKIRFDSDGKLKIAIFADLHYGEEPSTGKKLIQRQSTWEKI
jgi:hypothetical protein